MGRMDGKVVLVTGAGRGIGRESALLLAHEGARVMVADIDTQNGRATVAEIGASACFVELDVTTEQDWEAAIARVRKQWGELDVLVNNAAIIHYGSIEDGTLNHFRSMMKVNAEGTFLGCRYGVQAMKARGGSIVNIASLGAITGLPQFAAYCASKGAVSALSRAVSAHCTEAGYKIRCNVVLPDGVLTPMVANLDIPEGKLQINGDPMARMMQPRDVANAVLYLASDDSQWVNGLELRIDNGYTVSGV